MDAMIKAFLLQSLQKAASSGGLAFFDEILDQLSTDVLVHLRDSVIKILSKRANTAQVVDQPKQTA